MKDNSVHITYSDIDAFKKTVRLSTRLLEEIDPVFFCSPYTLIPVISQFMGLNTPLAGNGDSPHSITSIIFQLRNKVGAFREIYNFPLPEKRRIIDEICEMIAPHLLNEEDAYIDLIAGTKYRHLLKGSAAKRSHFTALSREKFRCLAPLIRRFNTGKSDYAHIVHYGHPDDLLREYDFLEQMPRSLAKAWRQNSFPVVNEIMLKNIPALRGKTQGFANGWVIFIANYTQELLEDSALRKRKILQAASLADKLGAKVVGMGGLIASFGQGGYYLSKEFDTLGFTTGHAYTISNIIDIFDIAAQKTNLNVKKSTLAVIGAAGSIGSGCAKLLSEKHPGEIILIDLNTFNAQQKLQELEHYIKTTVPGIKVTLTNSLGETKKADAVIIATNSTTSIINSAHLKRGAIVIDDSFPKNVSKDILKKRGDIILLEGGIMRLPPETEISSARNMPDLMDLPLTRSVSCKETYGCFAETLVLALHKYRKNYGLGHSDPALAKDIIKKAKSIGFASAPLQCFDEAVEERRFDRVSRILRNENKHLRSH